MTRRIKPPKLKEIDVSRLMAAQVLNQSPRAVAAALLGDRNFTNSLNISVSVTFNVGHDLRVEQGSFTDAVKRLTQGVRHVKIRTAEGQLVSFEGQREDGGFFTLSSEKVRLTNIEADVLSIDQEARLRSLDRVLKAHLIPSARAVYWREVCAGSPLSADEFVALNRDTLATPESLQARLQFWETLSLEQLVPDSFS